MWGPEMYLVKDIWVKCVIQAELGYQYMNFTEMKTRNSSAGKKADCRTVHTI
jgi:hypothetical protein